jgi:hypothetical protein
VKNVKNLLFYTRNQANRVYYSKPVENLKDGEWQEITAALKEYVNPKNEKEFLADNTFCYSTYITAFPAEGKEKKDVVFLIDNIICYDGELKFDPFRDKDAIKKAYEADPVWNAKPEK